VLGLLGNGGGSRGEDVGRVEKEQGRGERCCRAWQEKRVRGEHTWTSDDSLKKTCEGLQNKTLTTTKYEWVSGQFMVLLWEDTQGSMLLLKGPMHFFYLKGLRKMVKQWIRKCDVCQRNKLDLSSYSVLLEPLPIPQRIWKETFMDFINSLPMPQGPCKLEKRLFNCSSLISKKAQDMMKSKADKGRSEREFKEGDWVYLKLQPYRQLTIRQDKQNKLSIKFFGHFQVIKNIGAVAYKLQLPSHAMIHTVFHVSQLKSCHSDVNEMDQFPQCDAEGLIVATSFKLLGKRIAKQGNRAVAGLSLSQRKYCLKLLNEFGILGCKPTSTPIEVNQNKANVKIMNKDYFPLAMHDPLHSDLKLAFRVLRYLKYAPGKGVFYKKGDNFELFVYVYSDWAKCTATRRSVTKFAVFLGSSLVSWKSEK
nr:eukaryotic translation initiation factor 3 subunit B [Tanacetum cinerariifolium]